MLELLQIQKKSDLPELFRLLRVPAVLKIISNHGGYVTGE